MDAGGTKDEPEASSGENGKEGGGEGASPPSNSKPNETSESKGESQSEPLPVPSFDVQKQEIHPLLTQRLKKGDKW